tara:strand:+ start:1836 stop:2555 length:720 start_codon:yes stop_codon:yes gene_type:complete
MRILHFLRIFFTINISNSLSYYPYDPRIHNFGNIGLGGKIHASLARPITRLIDTIAYNGDDIRDIILENLKKDGLIENPLFISDWCCGAAMSTDALRNNFKNSSIVGVDTSNEMIKVAKKDSNSNAKFLIDDAETVELENKADLITIMFGFHEIPQEGRITILKNAIKNLAKNGSVLIIDIDVTYIPSKMMESGEPYIHDYLKNVQNDINSLFQNVIETVAVEGHVRQWLCKMPNQCCV